MVQPVYGRTVTASSRGTRGRHSTSDLPAIPTTLAPGFHHGIGAPILPPLQPHLSHTPVPYEAYESEHLEPSHPPDTVYDPYLHAPTIRPRIPYRSAAQEPILEFNGLPRQIGVEFFYQMVGAAPHDSSCSTHGYSHADFSVSSSKPYIGRPIDRVCEGDRAFEGDRGLGEEHERVQALHIEGKAYEGGNDGGDGGDDGEDEGEDVGDEEQPVPMAHASGFDERPRHGKWKGLIGSFMSMMRKISGSRNKRLDVAREIGPADGGLVDPELIPLYCGHVVGSIWRGQFRIYYVTVINLLNLFVLSRGSLKCRSRYMALTWWDLTDAQVRSLAAGTLEMSKPCKIYALKDSTMC
ncbi:hypothetical protein M9H77_09303 [Catharanthus roseus]|uniref:Uncharacterized protein n=1 Tax=Catharanthus roseus TaxID=4058 RepID=A0ACC0C061_CATRO|nr:hypothetical protein M9H77_09303 [Catharanthus roseus]